MISNDKIKSIINECAKNNYTVSVRDISYVLLCSHFDDAMVAYKCIFGNDYDYNQDYHLTYDNTGAILFLKDLMNSGGFEPTKKKKKSKDDDITFEENKAYMLKLKKDTEDAMAKGEIEKKDALKILTDISTKLNDKFSVKEENQNQVIFVNTKYNDICPFCQHEISRKEITKEEAMRKYDLVEKNE